VPLKPRFRRFPFRPKRLLKRKSVTVCIAVACKSGEYVVSCTDGALSQGGETFDSTLTKMAYFDDWQLMYAGEPSNADLIMENIRHETHALTRQNIQATIRRAYRQRLAQWVSDFVLAPYGMELDEFKKRGRQILTDQVAAQVAKDMNNAASQFNEELMVVGWGAMRHAVMIYGMNRDGAWSGLLTGIGAIGAGAEVARATLLLYGINRSSTLEDTLYAVAAAKFSAERCDGVGRNTTIYVSRKRNKEDPKGRRVGDFLTSQEILGLRRLWLVYGRVRVPDEASSRLMAISQRVSGGVSIESIPRLARAISRRRGRA
jgi:hypothetical protein